MSPAEEQVSQDTSSKVNLVPPEGEKVKMQDGREVQFNGKRKLLKDTIIDEANNTVSVRLDFRNGETRTFVIPPNLLLKFAGHGAEQKLGDETAGVEDIDDQVIGVDELISRLEKGEWSTKREASGISGTSVLLRALVEYRAAKKLAKGEPAEDQATAITAVKTFLENKTAKDKAALRASPDIKVIVDRLEAEKVAKASKVNTQELLDQLG